MKRREFLQHCSAVAAQMALTTVIVKGLSIPNASGQEVPIESLKRILNPDDGLVLIPQDTKFASFQAAFNKRTLVTPSIRVMCKTPEAIATTVQWAQQNNIPMATRGGGHSFEGLSQCTGLVIDTRLMSQISVAADKSTVTTAAGATLKSVYDAVGAKGVVIPAGSCPTVGVAGHTTGGGYGLLSRPFGLACDSLVSLDMITADGRLITANESQNSDLFWASRGAGSGSFGVITNLTFRTHKVGKIFTFGVTWRVKSDAAIQLIQAWQQWAPESPLGINAILKVRREKKGIVYVRCFGQSVGTESALRTELKKLTALVKPESQGIKHRTFLEAVRLYAGKETTMPTVFMKGKSDYLKSTMTHEGLQVFLKHLPEESITVIFDSYGGAIRHLRDDETAFAHRESTVCSIQYYMEWERASDTRTKLAEINTFYEAIRPYMSGSAYFNYCDLDLKDWATAYWGRNLDRLIQIKNSYDPLNVFRHAQSIPLRKV